MTSRPLRTALIGFGNIAAGYADDQLTARYYPYATHAQVLSAHPSFEWGAVVDISEDRLQLARKRWGIPYVTSSVEKLMDVYQPEVAVIATTPEVRYQIIRQLPELRAVIVEKPLGINELGARLFLDKCNQNGLTVQVNLWRRADETFGSLADGQMEELIGAPQAVIGVYGNGLLNNGTHMVDFVRMLFGEIEDVQVLGRPNAVSMSKIAGDIDVSFSLQMRSGLVVTMHSVDFRHYRENSLDIWGENGRISIHNEGLGISFYPKGENRAVPKSFELQHDRPRTLSSTVGKALYRMYDNFAATLNEGHQLCSSGESAFLTAQTIQQVYCLATSKK